MVRVLLTMTISTLFLVGVVAFVTGGLSGFLLAALLQIGRENGGRQPTLDASGLHPLDLPTH
jgi:hypothetical protein